MRVRTCFRFVFLSAWAFSEYIFHPALVNCWNTSFYCFSCICFVFCLRQPKVSPRLRFDRAPAAVKDSSTRSGFIGKVDSKIRSWGVEYDLILPKAAYLTLTGSYGAIIPFVPIYLKYVGLPVDQIGLLQTIRPAASFVASPIWAAVADKFGVYKLLLILALVLSTLMRLSMIWLTSFWTFFCLFVIMEFVGTPTGPLLDATVMKILGEERRQHYGKQRLWGGSRFAGEAFFKKTPSLMHISSSFLFPSFLFPSFFFFFFFFFGSFVFLSASFFFWLFFFAWYSCRVWAQRVLCWRSCLEAS